tara:strand:- start:20 stop:1195 length:1176 start_codon:yes stop_codon:yes gene_type:complete
MFKEKYKIEIKLRIEDIDREDWDNLAVYLNNPFYNWDWFFNLEKSKSVSQNTGWQPLYFLIYLSKELIGIAPLFLKNHSYGEFVFDQSFARLAEDLDLKYFPKLIGMSPYSPIEGYQFLYKENINKKETTLILLENIEIFAKKNKILSCNFLYADHEWGKLLINQKYQKWINTSSQWVSSGEEKFEDFLNRFNSNQRKNIRKERKSISKEKIYIKTITGNEINQDLMKNMHFFYEQHCLRWGVWGSKYLTYDFFLNCINNKENILIFCAYEELTNKIMAMSMCIKNNEKLWGRYWGCSRDVNNLHFELCYYKPIEWAIQNNIKFFDPGAGGQHKRRRGFYAKETFSFHKWFDKNMENIIGEWLTRVNPETERLIKIENESIPFKQEKKSIF